MAVDVTEVGQGTASPLGYMVGVARTVLSGQRSAHGQLRDTAHKYGIDSPQFAAIAAKQPGYAQTFIDSYNRGGPRIPTRARPVPGPAPDVQYNLGDILAKYAPAVPGKVPTATATPGINPTPTPTPRTMPTPPAGTSPGMSATEQWIAREREILARYGSRYGGTAADAAGSAARILPRVLAGAGAVIGAFYPSRIDPEVPIVPRAPGPTTRGGARRPSVPTKRPPASTTAPAPAVVRPYTPPAPILAGPPGPVTVPVTRPTVSPTVSGPGSAPSGSARSSPGTTDWTKYLGYLLPFVLPTASRGRASSSSFPQRSDFTVPANPGGYTDPLTGLNPGSAQWPQTQTRGSNDRCDCSQQNRRKRKKRKPRSVCYQGTYTELASGLIKRKKRKVPCRVSREKPA